jgi:hypothetical protein
MFYLQMQHIGSMSQVGEVLVWGLAQHQINEHRADTIYLNFAGPATSVEAIWAKLIERRTTAITDLNGKHHFIRHGGIPGQSENDVPYLRFQRRIEGLSIDHMILIDRRFSEVNYDVERSSAFVFEADNIAALVGHHVRQLVNVAVFDAWFPALLEIGRRERLVTPLTNFSHPVYHISLDRTRWELQISLGVEKSELSWSDL